MTNERVRWLMCGAVASFLTVTACGSSATSSSSGSGGAATSSSSSSTNGTQAAQSAVDAAQGTPSSFDPPGPSFDASKAKGKSLYYIDYSSSSSPVVKQWADVATRALGQYGVKVTHFDGQSQISEFTRGMQEAIAAKAGAILLMGIDPTAISAQVDAARSAGIPIFIGSSGDASTPSSPGVVASVTINHARVGKLLADYAITDSGGNADVAIVTHEGVLGTSVIVDNITNELHSLCPNCKVSTTNLPFAQIQTETALTQSLILKDPKLSYIIPVYDFETLAMVPAVQQANASGRVKLLSFNAIAAVMSKLASGSPIVADVGDPNDWFGYNIADQTLRILSGAQPVADEKTPLRLFTTANVKNIDVNADPGTWFGGVDYKSGFAKLWGGASS